MRKALITTVAVLSLGFTLTACGAGTGTDSDALPQANTKSSAPKAADAEDVVEKASTCDVAREAILTGSKKDITKSLKALQKDKKADATAREYARYYLGRDKGDAQMQEMDISLIQTSCSI